MFDEYCISESLSCSTSFIDVQQQQGNSPYVQQLLQMQKQTELIQKIISKFPKFSKEIENTSNDEQPVQNDMECSLMKRSESMVSIYSLSCDLANFTFTHQDRFKFGGQGSKCLREVKDKCSPQTYQYLSKIVQENRKQTRSGKPREKDQQRIDFLEEQKIRLQSQVMKQKQQIQELEKKMQKITKQNMEISRKMGQLHDQQKRLLRKEESLIYQKKICNSLQKQIKSQMVKLQQLYQSIQQNNYNTQRSNPQGINQKNKQESCQNLSESTIEESVEKPQISQLWKVMNKLQSLCSSLG